MNSKHPPIVSKNWKVLRGCAFGFHQPVMIGSLNFPGKFTVKTDELLDFFEQIFASPVNTLNSITEFGEFCELILDWSYQAHKKLRLPVFEKGRILSIQKTGNGDVYLEVALPCFESESTLGLLAWVVETVAELSQGDAAGSPAESLEKAISKLGRAGNAASVAAGHGVNMGRILPKAIEMGVPFRHIEHQVYLLGHGKHARFFNSTITDQTSSLGVAFARSKMTTANILRYSGLPTVTHVLVEDVSHALHMAEEMGYPVVVKPSDRDGGVGVYAGLTNARHVQAAYDKARHVSSSILLEKHIEGLDYRITVFNGQVIKAICRKPGGVTGDGVLNIEQLLELANSHPTAVFRARERGRKLLALDEEAMEILEENRLHAGSILPDGLHLLLRKRANVSSGGSTQDVLPIIHPDNIRLAVRAAEALRLDLAGVDFITPDISQSWLAAGGAICEVNSQPQISPEFAPNIHRLLIEKIVPCNGRIPVVLFVTPSSGEISADVPICQVADHLCRKGFAVYKTLSHGDWLDGELVSPPEMDCFNSATKAIFCREATAAVIQMKDADILSHGIPFRYIDLVCFMNPSLETPVSGAERLMAVGMIADHLQKGVVLQEGFDYKNTGDAPDLKKWIFSAETTQARTSLQINLDNALNFLYGD